MFISVIINNPDTVNTVNKSNGETIIIVKLGNIMCGQNKILIQSNQKHRVVDNDGQTNRIKRFA